MTRAAIYCRVSTDDQTTENQRRELMRYCESRGFEVFKVYEDSGVSGAKVSRPALDELMTDARRRKFDVVVVWKFDRLGRSVSHLLASLEEFENLGIDFLSMTEGIDTTSTLGRVCFTIVSAFAELERSLTIERVKPGLARAKDEGVKLGRPRTAFNFSKAVELRQRGWGYKRIADELDVPRTTIYRHLKGIPKTLESKSNSVS